MGAGGKVMTGNRAMEFSQEQQRAIDRRGHTLVQAGAGSGKTRVIVEWFCRAFMDYFPRANYDEIAAITFTEKAAGELRDRIRKRLRQLEQECSEETQRHRLRSLNSFLMLARIGTIHAFCARLLRESWQEAGVDPEFEILDEVKQYQLLEEVLEDTLAAWERGDSDKQAKLILLLSAYGSRESLKRDLRAMLRQRSRFTQPVARFLRSSAAELHHGFVKDEQVAQVCSRWFANDAKFDEIVSKLLKRKWDESHPFTQKILAAAAAYRDTAHGHERLARAAELLSLLIDENGNPRDEYLEALGGRRVVAEKDVKAAATSLPSVRDPNHQGTRAAMTLNRIMAEVFSDAARRYKVRCDGRKNAERRDLFDFEELELRALELLKGNYEARNRIRNLKALIVDEFQDTSALQWEIFRLILESVEDTQSSSGKWGEPIIFAVGDPAQSIYGWRQADPEIFSKCKQWVENHGGEVLNLSTNYRTQAPVLEFINEFCGEVFADWANDGLSPTSPVSAQNTFMKLRADRSDEGGKVWRLGKNAGGAEQKTEEKSDEEDSATGLTEGSLNGDLAQVLSIVNFLKQKLISPSCPHVVGREFQWSDVAFLCRKRRYFAPIEMILRKEQIPYITYGGSGFYDQPEIVALLNALRVLDDPDDDFSVLGFLRGAFVHCPDPLLFKVAKTPGSSLWVKAKIAATRDDKVPFPLSDAEKRVLTNALQAIDKASERLGAVTVDRLLEDLIEQLGVWGAIEFHETPRQAEQNVQKLVAIARKFQTTGLGTFLNYVDEHEEAEEAEGSAVLPEISTDAVKIMTIHAAKGLEFPIVVLPFLESPLNLRVNLPATDGEKWFACSRSLDFGPETGDKNGLKIYLEQWTKARQLEEEKRTLYVAMTRAKDFLLLSDFPEKGSNKASVGKWLDGFLQASANGALCEKVPIPKEHDSRAISDSCPLLPGAHKPTEETSELALFDPFDLSDSLRAKAEQACAIHHLAKEQIDFTLRDRPPLAPPPLAIEAPLTVGVSEFLSFLTCPTQYYYDYVLELPDIGYTPPELESTTSLGEEEILSASDEGTLLHTIFEDLLHESVEPTDTAIRETVDRVLKETLGEERLKGQSQLAEKFVRHVSAAFGAGKFARIQKAKKRSFEVGLVASIMEGFAISGTIDCIFESSEGFIEIADFKTGAKAAEDDNAHQYYRLQMKLYLWMLSHHIGSQDTYRATLLYTQEEMTPEEITMTVADLEDFGKSLQERAREFRLFHRELVDGEMVPCPQLYEKLVSWCQRGKRACPHHVGGTP